MYINEDAHLVPYYSVLASFKKHVHTSRCVCDIIYGLLPMDFTHICQCTCFCGCMMYTHYYILVSHDAMHFCVILLLLFTLLVEISDGAACILYLHVHLQYNHFHEGIFKYRLGVTWPSFPKCVVAMGLKHRQRSDLDELVDDLQCG